MDGWSSRSPYRIVPNSDQAQESFQETFFCFHASCTCGELITYPKMALSSGYQRRLQRAAPAADLSERQRIVLALRNFRG